MITTGGILGGVAVATLLLAVLAPDRNEPDRPTPASDYGSHGTARWSTLEEIQRQLTRHGPGLIVGRGPDGLLYHPTASHLNQFCAVIGGSGSRKTRSYVVPNVLAETTASLVITDPKGQVYRLTAAVKAAQGYRIRVINLLATRASDRYNPLSYVRSPLEAQRLATNLTQNTEGGRPAGGDPFWPKAEGALITALVLYVTMKLPPAERHLASVLELGTTLAGDQQTMDAVFDALPQGHPSLRSYNIFRLAADKTRAGILIGFAVRLQLWADSEMATLTATSDLDLSEPGRERTALYMIIPDSESTYVPLTALFWTQVFQELYSEADRHEGTLPVPVRLILDEFSNVGQITDYPKKISTCRGRGISPEMILQDVSQLRSLYGEDDARTILASCDSLLYLGTNELDTAVYISRRLGQTTVQLTTTSTPSTPQAGASETRTYHGRPLLTPDEVLMLDSDNSLLLQRGRYPARLQKPDYTELSIPIRELAHQDYQAPPRPPLSLVDCSRLPGVAPARPTPPTPLRGKEGPPGHTGRMRLVRPILTALATEEED